MITKPLAVTFDWYGTLARHANGVGRGKQFGAYLATKGLKGDAWDRRVLYEVFDFYAEAYRPNAPNQQQQSFWTEFTQRLFRSFNVHGESVADDSHAHAIQTIFGHNGFALFEDVEPTLRNLKARGLRLGVVSNWHRGLDYFCHGLGIRCWFDVIVSSGDIGVEKPDPGIFSEALRELSISPQDSVHVGDSVQNDFEGAATAGMQAILLDRRGIYSDMRANRIGSLHELLQLFS